MHAVTNVCMKHIHKVIYDLSVDLVIFDLGLTFDEIERANQGHWVFSGLYFIG